MKMLLEHSGSAAGAKPNSMLNAVLVERESCVVGDLLGYGRSGAVPFVALALPGAGNRAHTVVRCRVPREVDDPAPNPVLRLLFDHLAANAGEVLQHVIGADLSAAVVSENDFAAEVRPRAGAARFNLHPRMEVVCTDDDSVPFQIEMVLAVAHQTAAERRAISSFIEGKAVEVGQNGFERREDVTRRVFQQISAAGIIRDADSADIMMVSVGHLLLR
jgi:hypothetical protein